MAGRWPAAGPVRTPRWPPAKATGEQRGAWGGVADPSEQLLLCAPTKSIRDLAATRRHRVDEADARRRDHHVLFREAPPARNLSVQRAHGSEFSRARNHVPGPPRSELMTRWR